MSLLQIEIAFLEQTKEIFEVENFKLLDTEFKKALASKFDNSLKQGALFTKSLAYFKGDECTKKFKDAGIKKWTVETFIFNVYGIQKSWFHKCCKGHSNLDKVEAYKELCNIHNFGFDIADFNYFAKNDELPQLAIKPKTEATETEATETEATETEATETEATETEVSTLLTLTFKGLNGNVSVRIDNKKAVHSTNSTDEILKAIAFLKSCLPS